MEMISIKDVSDFIDCGMVNNNARLNYVVYMENIHDYLLNMAQVDESLLFPFFKQTNVIIENLFRYDNKELKNDFFKLRKLVMEYSLEDNQE